MGDWKATNSSFFLGTRPRLSNLDILQFNEKRSELLGLSNGTVILEIEVKKKIEIIFWINKKNWKIILLLEIFNEKMRSLY